MATALHQFVDKENVGAAPSAKNRGVGLSFKRTQDSTSLVTPRRALGNINRDLKANRQKTPCLKDFTQNASVKPRTALASIPQNKPISVVKPKKEAAKPFSLICSNTFKSTASLPVDEIEHVHKPEEVEDDYEDILPKKERLSTYVDKLISWRPFCFRKWDDSEIGDTEEDEMLLIDDLSDVPIIKRDDPALYASLYSCDPEPIPEELLEISLPELNDPLDLPEEFDSKISI